MKIVAKPIKAVAFFWPGRMPRPYKFKIAEEGEEERTILVDHVFGYSRSKIAGIDSLIFECQSLIDGVDRRYQLKYIIKDYRWELYKI